MTALPSPTVLTGLVGIPYVERGRTHEGADCWGVCLLAARELWGIELPEYFYTESEILAHACEHIRRETTSEPHWHQVHAPYPLAAIHIFRIRGFEVHCGIHVGNGEFLHSLAGRNSCVETLRSMAWVQRRTGSYAWQP